MRDMRRLRLMLTGLFLALAVIFLFNLAIDPRGAWWRVHPVPPLYRRVRAERVITPYLLRTTAPETLLLGSSRVLYGMKIEQGIKGGIENGAMSGSRLAEISRELDIALRNPHLKRILWGVEFYTFDSLSDRPNAETMARLNGDLRIKLTDNIMSYDALVASYRMVLRSLSHDVSAEANMQIPWPGWYICYKFAHPNSPTLAQLDEARRFHEVSDLPEYRRFNYSAALRRSFGNLVQRIHAAHVELIAFVAPVTEYELEMIRQTGRWSDFQHWKRDVAEQIPYTDFSGYNGIATSDAMFIDAWHMGPAAGQTIMRILLGLQLPDCGDAKIVADSAMRVTASNVDTILAIQNQQRDAAIAAPNLYSTTVTAAVHQRYGNIATASMSAHR
jgi:hypothetical protein